MAGMQGGYHGGYAGWVPWRVYQGGYHGGYLPIHHGGYLSIHPGYTTPPTVPLLVCTSPTCPSMVAEEQPGLRKGRRAWVENLSVYKVDKCVRFGGTLCAELLALPE